VQTEGRACLVPYISVDQTRNKKISGTRPAFAQLRRGKQARPSVHVTALRSCAEL
jgi:hypothetical protein